MRIACFRNFAASLTFLLPLLGGLPVEAAVIYDHGAPVANSPGFTSDATQREGDDFELGGAVTLSGVQWWGFYGPADTPVSDNFTIQLFDLVSGVPATTPFYSAVVGDVGRTDTGLTGFAGDTIYLYSAVLPDVTLGSGQYLLSIVNDTTSDTDDFWNWALVPSQGDEVHWFRRRDNDSWFLGSGAGGGNFAFQLTGDFVQVPEPAALALFGVGLAGLGLLRRGRAKRKPGNPRAG